MWLCCSTVCCVASNSSDMILWPLDSNTHLSFTSVKAWVGGGGSNCF